MTEIVIALISLIIGAAISQAQMDEQNKRAAHDTKVRGYIDAFRSKFGITLDQLSQAASRLDIDLTRLQDAARGSARLADASRKLRDFTSKYPEKVSAINSAKNKVQSAINDLSSKAESASHQIQQGRQYSDLELATMVNDEVKTVNDAVSQINTELTKGEEPNRNNQIEVNLVRKE